MFYEKSNDAILRFGDILKGHLSSGPIVISKLKNTEYNLEVVHPKFSVVLSPCCSITDGLIVILTPLIQVRPSFFNNPFFADDLTRLNEKIAPENCMPEKEWNKLPDEEKKKRKQKGPGFAFMNLFIYEPNQFLPEYEVHNKEKKNFPTSYYMIDFKNVTKIQCPELRSPENIFTTSKLSQLSIMARDQLRRKIAFYYARVPIEDEI